MNHIIFQTLFQAIGAEHVSTSMFQMLKRTQSTTVPNRTNRLNTRSRRKEEKRKMKMKMKMKMKKDMGFLSGVQKSLNRIYHFSINQLGVFNLSQPNSTEANILFLGQNMDYKKAVISNLSDEVSSEYSTSWEFSNGEIKFKFFDLGEHRIAHRAWSDYRAKMDAVVYIVDADALTQEELLGPGEELNAQLWDHFRGPREELNALLSDEVFVEVPFVIFGVTSTGARSQLKERLCYFLSLPFVTIELTSTGTSFQLKERLRYFLSLPNVTIERVDTNARPLEVFVAQALHKEEYLNGFQWLSHYIKLR